MSSALERLWPATVASCRSSPPQPGATASGPAHTCDWLSYKQSVTYLVVVPRRAATKSLVCSRPKAYILKHFRASQHIHYFPRALVEVTRVFKAVSVILATY
ncbi:hypothetical protein E2C01_065336 [Portunus trituberculatus]|uniref:Uncharacterized protein n=1 Tax=Portunus trituberculatus TaxID=210409 RepID=A0A5B7HPA8_PORTR|nr:hypothetical protein [Portunus trituberculatus]